MLPSLRRCAEPMTQTRTVMVKLTLKGNGIYPSLFRTLCTIFVKLHSIVPLGETVCRTHDSTTLTQGQGYTSMLWDSAARDLAVLFEVLSNCVYGNKMPGACVRDNLKISSSL